MCILDYVYLAGLIEEPINVLLQRVEQEAFTKVRIVIIVVFTYSENSIPLVVLVSK